MLPFKDKESLSEGNRENKLLIRFRGIRGVSKQLENNFLK
jgi:hypothetical protein